jgi:choline dehydrogenase-like flavoprotein
MPAKQPLDVCVVGSGPGGGIAAYVLAAAGLKTALVEAGPGLRAGVDYGMHWTAREIAERRARGDRRPIPNLWADFRERNHFTPVGDRPDHGWVKALGGRSLCWAGHSLRFGPLDFRPWPLSYEEVAPYYSRAERFMGVYGYRDGLWNLPDGEFLKPVPMRCPEAMLKRGVERLKARGRKMEFVAQRKAMLTEPHSSGRPLCHFCGHCTGCCVDAKYTSANTPIPLAERTGNLTVFPESMMTRLVAGRSGRQVTAIEYVNAQGKKQSLEARAFVLACGAVETARQLLISKLANSSGQVGRNLTSHFGLTVVGYFPELARRDASTDDGTNYYHSLLTGLYWDQPNPKFQGTYQVQCGAGVTPYRVAVRDVPGYGASFKREFRERNAGHAGMNMQGSLLISPRKFVDLDPARRDRYGLAVARVHLHYEGSDVAMAEDMVETCEEIIRAGGGRVHSRPSRIAPDTLVIDSNHWVGTARMGRDPKTSVVNPDGRCHDLENLWIGDASVFPANPEKNPTLTNIALSWRMAERVVAGFRAGSSVIG